MKRPLSLEALDERTMPAVMLSSAGAVVHQPYLDEREPAIVRPGDDVTHIRPESASGLVPPGADRMFNPQPEPPVDPWVDPLAGQKVQPR